MIVVSDTSPLNYLAAIDHIDLLPTLYGQILIPSEVAGELRAARNAPSTRSLALAPPAWLVIRQVSPDPTLSHLDPGEQAAITLAQSDDAELLLCDDRRGRLAAERRSIVVTGTIGVLQLAAIRRLLHLPDAIKQLTSTTNFRISNTILQQIMTRYK